MHKFENLNRRSFLRATGITGGLSSPATAQDSRGGGSQPLVNGRRKLDPWRRHMAQSGLAPILA